MKKGWEIKKLGEVCEIRPPKKEAKEKLKEQDLVSFLPMEDLGVLVKKISPRNDRPLKDVAGSYTYFADNDILLAKITPCFENGKLGIARGLTNGIGFGSSEYVVLRNRGQLIEEYLFYYLSREEFRQEGTRNMTGAVGHKRVSKEFIENYKIPVPPLPEQQRIVSILDECFAAIDQAKINAEQNLKNARELFESYLQGVFGKLFKVSETKRISEVAKVIGGYSFKSSDFKKEGRFQVIRMGNVRPGIIRENESPVFINELEQKALSKALLIPKDVIITQTGTKNKRDYGFTVIIEKENYLLNQRIAAIRFKKEYLPKFFLYFSWTNIFKDQYFANETGTVGQGNVGIGAITESLVPSIPLNEQQDIVRRLDALQAETQKLEALYQQKIAGLEELKKFILKKAFAGELSKQDVILT